MNETYRTKGIVLSRLPFRENDSRVVIYSREQGKVSLVARGTQKMGSKLAGHIEPLNLIDLMVVRGRQYDYIGSAINETCYLGIKNNFEKVFWSGRIINQFNQIVKDEEADKYAFSLLKEVLNAIDSKKIITDFEFLEKSFIMKLISLLGQKPELEKCVVCENKVLPENSYFDIKRGGLLCANCQTRTPKFDRKYQRKISSEIIKIIRFLLESDFHKILKLRIPKNEKQETQSLIGSFFEFTS